MGTATWGSLLAIWGHSQYNDWDVQVPPSYVGTPLSLVQLPPFRLVWEDPSVIVEVAVKPAWDGSSITAAQLLSAIGMMGAADQRHTWVRQNVPDGNTHAVGTAGFHRRAASLSG